MPFFQLVKALESVIQNFRLRYLGRHNVFDVALLNFGMSALYSY